MRALTGVTHSTIASGYNRHSRELRGWRTGATGSDSMGDQSDGQFCPQSRANASLIASALLPGQAVETPAATAAAVMLFVQVTLEALVDVIDLLEARRQQGLARLQ